MQFQKFRLAGFKSFVEPAEVEIAGGLTGIVGPNGCGKSNLVEALRWVMGETSAKRLRGGEMDDVIFGGAAARPPRNIAEVTLVIDNTARSAPAMFNAFDEIEIRRRIERGAGSDYRVNGKSVRARDVQLLFADAAIGAESPALVSQGRVAALIAAKPAERRYVLEDAAGIGGMQARRHEAEMKLQGAEANLRQIDVLLESLHGQAANLKRQARQAETYRALAEQIRAAEALLLYVIWREAATRCAAAESHFRHEDAAVAAALVANEAAGLRESKAELHLPALRAAREQAHLHVRELTQTQAALAADQHQRERDIQTALTEQAQAEQDRMAERAGQESAGANLESIQAEMAALEEQATPAAQAIATARQQREVAAAASLVAEQTALNLAAQLANDRARAASLARQAADLQSRQAQGAVTVSRLEAEMQALAGQDAAPLRDYQAKVAAAGQELARLQAAVETARARLAAAQETDMAARLAANQESAGLTQHRAEMAGLQRSLATGTGKQDFPAVLEQLRVTPGYEAALAAALSGDLAAAIEETAPHRWRNLAPMARPDPESLANHVEGPPELHRALQAVRLVEPAQALARQQQLHPGEMLVTREGALYRWDGLVRESAGPSAEAIRLAQRNELEHLAEQLPALEAVSQQAIAMAEAAAQAWQEALAAERALGTELASAAAAVRAAEQALASATAAESAQETQRLRLQDALASAAETVAHSAAELQRVLAEQAGLPNLAGAQAALDRAQRERAAAREAADLASRALQQAELAEEARLARLAALAREQQSWQDILGRGTQQMQAIAGRLAAAQARERAARETLPEIISAIAALLDELAAAEQQERQAGDALVAGEQDLARHRQIARAAQAALSEAREWRGGAEARLAAARDSVAEAAHQLRERCHLTPEAVAGSLSAAEEAAERAGCERELAELLRKREGLGAVNLRAEAELAEVSSELHRIEQEKTDLLLAIERLRQAVGTLNREARERLLAAFETVQVQFRRLFTTLFGGGEAELTLTGLDDPLTAGLEIYASPPGKKLQMLSLLSGGEQALTALALLFAMFLATPAPVCVLDEVDAPLDDANVTRFCDLLSEIATTTGTRFLVITHHRVTMARMDRLYGVTMAERGVSQLVSVDLKVAETMGES